jgi:hypothetical protein
MDVLAVFRVTTGVTAAALPFYAAHSWCHISRVLQAFWLPPSALALMLAGFSYSAVGAG